MQLSPTFKNPSNRFFSELRTKILSEKEMVMDGIRNIANKHRTQLDQIQKLKAELIQQSKILNQVQIVEQRKLHELLKNKQQLQGQITERLDQISSRRSSLINVADKQIKSQTKYEHLKNQKQQQSRNMQNQEIINQNIFHKY